MYQKNRKYLEAVAVYEHLRDLEPEKFDYLNTLIELYTFLQLDSKVAVNLKLLFEVQLQRHDFGASEQTLNRLDSLFDSTQTAYQHQQITYALMADQLHDPQEVLRHIKTSVVGFCKGMIVGHYRNSCQRSKRLILPMLLKLIE